MSGKKTLNEKLGAAKKKAAVREFDVAIMETSEIMVTVKAKSRAEAERIASENWKNGAYLNEPENYRRAKIEALPFRVERSQNGEER